MLSQQVLPAIRAAALHQEGTRADPSAWSAENTQTSAEDGRGERLVCCHEVTDLRQDCPVCVAYCDWKDRKLSIAYRLEEAQTEAME